MMARYAALSDDRLTIDNIVDAPPAFARRQGLMPLDGKDPEPGIGWTRSTPKARTWTPPADPDAEADPEPDR